MLLATSKEEGSVPLCRMSGVRHLSGISFLLSACLDGTRCLYRVDVFFRPSDEIHPDISGLRFEPGCLNLVREAHKRSGGGGAGGRQ